MTTMSVHTFDELATNIEIIQSIFQLLNFEEQLKFAQVSSQLKYIFSNFILKFNYEKVLIIKDPPMFHVRNDTDLLKLHLTAKEFEEFLKLYGCDIKELQENCSPCLNVRKFPNLTSLNYSNITVTKTQMESVARYCKKIESITVTSCFTDEGPFKLCTDLELKTVMEMKQLKYLNLSCFLQFPLRYIDFLDLITKTNLKHLILSYYVMAQVEDLPLYDQAVANSLEELKISVTFHEKWYQKNFPKYLSLFENLNTLQLHRADTIDNESLQNLAKTCKKLKILNIISTKFLKVSNFNLLTSVVDLTVLRAEGLSHKNLRQILTEMNLLRFTSLQTKYDGEFENFEISSKIQSLNIHDLKTYGFKGAYEENNTLKSLVWHDKIHEPHLQPATLKCAYLERLEIWTGFIALEIVLQLKSLISLTIKSSAKKFTWSYICHLLRDHVSLQEFKLENLRSSLKREPPPMEAFECARNLKYLTISIDIFEVSMDFWLDMLDNNSYLTLKCPGLVHYDLVRNLLKSSKFPTSLRTICIDGVKVACKDLRQNFDLIMEKIKQHTRLPSVAFYVNEYGLIFN